MTKLIGAIIGVSAVAYVIKDITHAMDVFVHMAALIQQGYR